MKTIITYFFLLLLFVSCKNLTSTQTGIIYVSVVDTGGNPVPNEMIIITPDSLEKSTNENGVCKFEVPPGRYFVNAQLPGPGPAGYIYQKLVKIKSNETIRIKLKACPYCR